MTGAPTDASSECGHLAGALLDFHVNGSLEGGEAAMVAAHVAECAACARDVGELRSIAAAIAAHGVSPASSWRGGPLWAWIGTAAALLVVGFVIARIVPSGPAEPVATAAAPAQGAPALPPDGRPQAGGEFTLDLGSGVLRDVASRPPRVDLTRGISTLRLTFLSTVVPGTELRMSVVGPGERPIVAEEALPQHDAMGRVTFAVPAARFPASGTYQVVLRPADAGSGAGPFFYPFEVQVPANGS